MKFKTQGTSVIEMEYKEGENKSTLLNTKIYLDLDKKVDENLFYKNGDFTKEGSKLLTQTFIQGLGANIHTAHNLKTWDSAEHLRYIIKELERIFVENVTIIK